jgi:hypothetical protein
VRIANRKQVMTNLTQIKKIGGIAAAVAVIGAAYGLHRWSVHNQNCLSYERQMQAQLSKMGDILTQAVGAMSEINANPFAAFGMLGMIGPMMQETYNVKTASNNTRYAYVKTCGESRWDAWRETPSARDKLEQIRIQQEELSNLKDKKPNFSF